MDRTLHLLDGIRREIERDGPLSFARFMEHALYDPQHGYYAHGAGLGPAGDFVTAADAGRDFGRCIARQIAEIDRRIGPFDPFDVLEFGAGRGLLARDVLDAMREEQPALAGRARYTMVERSPALRARALVEAPEARALDLQQLTGGRRGVALAVELFDALPVHRVRRRGGALREIRVGADPQGRLVEVETPAPQALHELAARYGAAAEEGTEAELAPAAPALLAAMAAAFERGILIVVDYGDRAERLYSPRNPAGTLLAYHAHRTNTDYLERIGRQDLTAHVNFTALEDAARAAGLALLGLTTQDRFLIAHGVLEPFTDPRVAHGDPRQVRRRLRALQLVHPEAMGRRFKVLLLAKGLDPAPALGGLDDPFARHGPGAAR